MNRKVYLEEYPKYRNLVLAKANGKNIHKLNGLLGTILNQGLNYLYWKNKNKNKNKTEELSKILKDTERKIFQLTKVHFQFIKRINNG